MFRTKVSRSDAVVFLLLLALTLLAFLLPLFLQKEEANILLVDTPEGSFSYSLSVDREIPLCESGISLVIEIKDGKARVRESECPDKVCVAGGWISRSGESVLCVPAKVRLLVKGGVDDVDFVAG